MCLRTPSRKSWNKKGRKNQAKWDFEEGEEEGLFLKKERKKDDEGKRTEEGIFFQWEAVWRRRRSLVCRE